MADGLPPTNGVKTGEADVSTVQCTGTALHNVGSPAQPCPKRPRSTHCDFRESRHWAQANLEWIDGGNQHFQHTLDRRRASEDILRSQHLPPEVLESESGQQSPHQPFGSDTESFDPAEASNCLGRSLSTGNWLKLRRDTAHRKIQVHHQFGRLVKKITDASNWASKEPTASLGERVEPECDNLAQPGLQTKARLHPTRRSAKISKKPGMENIRAQKEATDKTPDKSSELNTDGTITPNAAELNRKWSTNFSPLRKQDIEEAKKRSADLREVLSGYHSDRHGNLLPEINTDTIGKLASVPPGSREQDAKSETAWEPRSGSDPLRSTDLTETNAWKTSNPSTSKYLLNPLPSPPQPGPRLSSRHSIADSGSTRRLKDSHLAGPSTGSAREGSPCLSTTGSLAEVLEPLDRAASKEEIVATQLPERASTDAISVLGTAPSHSTDTLTAIASEALGSSRPPTPYRVTGANSLAARSSTRPTKLHSGFVSSAKAPSDAPNRPLPALPEVPTPESLETSRREAGSPASSRSRRSLQHTTTQPGHNRRTSHSVCMVSLDGVLQGTTSPEGSPQQKSKSIPPKSSIRWSLDKRSSSSSNPTGTRGPNLASVGKPVEVQPPDVRHDNPLAAFVSGHDTRETLTRDQRIHDKRLHDIASARAMRSKRVTEEDYPNVQPDAAATDFPTPPSSRTEGPAAVDRPTWDLPNRAVIANTSASYLSNTINLHKPQVQHVSPESDTPSLANHVPPPQLIGATSRSHGTGSEAAPVPLSAPTSISRVMEPSKNRRIANSKHSHVSPRSSATVVCSLNCHGTQTPPLSESSTPSSDEDGTGVMGAEAARTNNAHKSLHLAASDLAAMVTDMQIMRDQLNAQLRLIQSQSKQIRAIEVQKLRILDAVNALVAVVREPITVAVPVNALSRGERQVPLEDVKENPYLGWRDKDSIGSRSNTVMSGDGASTRSGSSDMTFITEPDAVSNELEQGQRGVEFNMDFDRMQELIRLDRGKVGSGLNRLSSNKRGGEVGYLSIDM